MMKRVLQASYEVLCRLPVRRLAISFAAVRKHHAEYIGAAPLAFRRDYGCPCAEVDLRFFAGRTFHSAHRERCSCAKMLHEATHTTVATCKTVLVSQVLVDALRR